MTSFAHVAKHIALNDARNQRWTVKKRPQGGVDADDFGFEEVAIRDPKPGEVLLKTLYLSLAPVMRAYMSGESVAGEQPLAIGDVIHGRGIAQIVKSRHADWTEGQVVQGQLGWQTFKTSAMTPEERFRRMPPNDLPASFGLGALGMTGFSAWAGLIKVGAVKTGETVLVSGAVGGVGSMVTQIAANVYGCEVVGIAGSDEKCALAKAHGCAAMINYRSEDVTARFSGLLPNGIDLYFDNVGGEILDAAMNHLREQSRIVLCGSISEYTRGSAFALPGYQRLRRTDSQMRGFFVYNHLNDWARAMDEMAEWIRAGKVRPIEQMTYGFENMPSALSGLYEGKNVGKQLCHVRGEPQEWI